MSFAQFIAFNANMEKGNMLIPPNSFLNCQECLNVISSATSYYNFAVGDANERIGSLENRTGQFEEKVMSIENTITNIQGINASGCHYDTDSQLG